MAYGISVTDPRAVLGVSTIKVLFNGCFNPGDDIGSTCAVKILFLLGIVPPLSGYFVSANDNRAPALKMAA